MKISTIAQKVVNQVKPAVKTAVKAVKKNPLLFGAGALGLYLGYKVVDSFKKSNTDTGVIPPKESEKEVKPKIEPKGIISDKKPVTIKDLIDQYMKNRNKTKVERLKDFMVIFIPRPINPTKNPYVDQDKYNDFIKQLIEIENQNKKYNFDDCKIPENLTREERIAYIEEHGGPGLNYNS